MSERPVRIDKIKPSDYEMAGLSDVVRDYIFDLEKEIDAYEQWEKENPKINGETSDGYHTFNELYDHRCLLWINLCNLMPGKCYLVPEHFEGWFLLGMETQKGQISYHCPNKFYDLIEISIPKKHPEYDGHTSSDVIERLKKFPFCQPKDAVHSCDCNKDGAKTVKVICDGIVQCPRCGGVMATKPKDAVSVDWDDIWKEFDEWHREAEKNNIGLASWSFQKRKIETLINRKLKGSK